MMETESALVLFSGGQDSAACLAWALERHPRVETVGFDYGQRHSVEMAQREVVLSAVRARFPAWAERLGPDHRLDLTAFGAIGETAPSGPSRWTPGACPIPSCQAVTSSS